MTRPFQVVVRRRRRASILPVSWAPLVAAAVRDLEVSEGEARLLVGWAHRICNGGAPAW